MMKIHKHAFTLLLAVGAFAVPPSRAFSQDVAPAISTADPRTVTNTVNDIAAAALLTLLPAPGGPISGDTRPYDMTLLASYHCLAAAQNEWGPCMLYWLNYPTGGASL